MSEPWHSPAPDAERARVLALLMRHGDGPTSFQALEPGFHYWFDPEEEGAVAYVPTAGHRVVAGQPICAGEHRPAVTARFLADSRAARRRVVFFGVEAPFLTALEGQAHDALAIAEQPDWDPAGYSVEGPARRGLRAQINRARNKGVRVRRIDPEELAHAPGSLRAEIEVVLARWLASRHMSVMRFMVDLEPFSFPEERRYYVAEQGDRPVGFLAAIPVYRRRGWFFEDVIRVPDAPNGTAELLIHAALSDARDRGDGYVTLGMAPLAGVEAGPGPHRGIRRLLAACRRHLDPLYSFEGVRRFKQRFKPDRWTPLYLVTSPGPVGLRSLHALLRAFAGGGLFRFGLDTALRVIGRLPARFWAACLWLLAGLLIPWTLLLAVADGRHWFGDTSIQWAWVFFDAGLCVNLFVLARLVSLQRPAARSLSLFLAGTTLTDFLLSSVQAFHLHRSLTGWPLLLVFVGISGPAVATAMLLVIARVTPVRQERR